MCERAEAAFNETAAKFAVMPKAPHVGMVNCDKQPVLCNSWGAGTGSIWIIDMLPEPAPITIFRQRLNLTHVHPDDIMDMYKSGSRPGFELNEGYFHPFDGVIAKNGLALPVGYLLWLLNVIPSWAMMVGISFLSRNMM